MSTDPSTPDLLGSAPGRGQGVRRLNRIPLLIAMAILAVIMAAIAYTYHFRLQASRQSGETGRKPETAIGVLADAPDAGYIPPAVPELAPPPPLPQPQLQAPPLEPEKPDPHRARLGELSTAGSSSSGWRASKRPCKRWSSTDEAQRRDRAAGFDGGLEPASRRFRRPSSLREPPRQGSAASMNSPSGTAI